MTKRIIAALAVVLVLSGASVVSASGYDWHFNLRDAGDTTDIPYDLSIPGDGNDHVVAIDGSSKQPKFLDAIPQSMVTGLSDMSTTMSNMLVNQTRYASSTIRSITSSTGATGFIPFPAYETGEGTDVHYSATIVTTATIGGGQSGTIVLEYAPFNSATSTDWTEVGRCTNGQTISLAIVLQSVQTSGCEVSGWIPPGNYAKLRSINNTGTPTYTYNSGQEIPDYNPFQ